MQSLGHNFKKPVNKKTKLMRHNLLTTILKNALKKIKTEEKMLFILHNLQVKTCDCGRGHVRGLEDGSCGHRARKPAEPAGAPGISHTGISGKILV